MINGVNMELVIIVKSGAAPGVSYAALFAIVCFTFSNLESTNFLDTKHLRKFIELTENLINTERHDAQWLVQFNSSRLNSLLQLVRNYLGYMF